MVRDGTVKHLAREMHTRKYKEWQKKMLKGHGLEHSQYTQLQ